MRILLVEDDQSLQRTLLRLFATQNFAVDATASGKEASFLAKTNDYDVVVLDIMLPDIDGFEVIREIRDEKINVPILLLTAIDDAESKIKGLNRGADDYLPKPFHAGELLARIRALSRRSSEEKSSRFNVDDIWLDTVLRKAFRGSAELNLTPREFALLEYLVLNKRRIVSRAEILEHVWDINFDPISNIVDAHVKGLRKKIDGGRHHTLIKTIRGMGYTISAEQ